MRPSPAASGGLPLLAPMSEVAGRLAPQVGAHALEKAHGGRGVLLGGVPGVPAADVLVIGGGVSGTHAATIAVGMGAHVTILDRSLEALQPALRPVRGPGADRLLDPRGDPRMGRARPTSSSARCWSPAPPRPSSSPARCCGTMKPGAVLVDIAIDQGGCCETSKPTTHSHPTYVVDGIVHYCVANMPGAVARTSTFALNNATLPFTLALATRAGARR